MCLKLFKRMKMTRFERAYIDIYNGRILLSDFAAAAGFDDPVKARAALSAYRRKVVCGEIPDPRDTYGLWR